MLIHMYPYKPHVKFTNVSITAQKFATSMDYEDSENRLENSRCTNPIGKY